MAKATMTSKGQLTLPKQFRDALGLATGTTLDVSMADGAVVLRPAERIEDKLRRFAEILPKRRGRPRLQSQKDIDDAIAAAVTQRHRRGPD
jgi:AbrB family looped-hinge helix DNA binding protein